MTRRRFQPKSDRRGAIAILACFLMILILGMAAFAIDLGYIANSRAELQRSADAAALAACWHLVYQGVPGTPVDLTGAVAEVPVSARQYAALNPVCNTSPGLADTDIRVGYMANPGAKDATIQSGNPNTYNAVQVTVRRTADQNGKVGAFFGRIFGMEGVEARASATAALINNFGGFRAPSATEGDNCNLMILPFALDKQTWDELQEGTGYDVWNYDSAVNQVRWGSDRILEVNLFPQGTGSPGNRGTVNIGASHNSTAVLCRQIVSGISPEDLAYYPDNQLKFDANGHLYLNADPGISAGCKSALASIIGQTRMIPIFTSVVGNGNNACYEIVEFVGVRIMAVNLTGSMNSKHLTVQPALVFTRGGIPGDVSSGHYSYGVYSPVWLVQ